MIMFLVVKSLVYNSVYVLGSSTTRLVILCVCDGNAFNLLMMYRPRQNATRESDLAAALCMSHLIQYREMGGEDGSK